LLVAVGDEATIAKLDRYKEITAKLADPRKINEAEAEQFGRAKGKFCTGRRDRFTLPKPLARDVDELAYRLAVEESPFIQAIRRMSSC